MAEQNLGPRDFFAKEDAIADLGLIACPGAEELCKLVTFGPLGAGGRHGRRVVHYSFGLPAFSVR